MKNPIILICILLIGLALRVYNLNFPSIGYHNMKENESLSIAQEMERTGDFINKRVYFYNAFSDNSVVKDDPQPALVSYQTLLAWRIFGENIWSPRLINVLFGVLSILIIYLMGLLLFNNRAVSFFCAFLLAIMPLGVFFSRNLQPESPAFFFMLLGNFFYLRYCASAKKNNLFLAGFAVFIAWLYKFNFIIGALPVLLCLSLKTKFADKKEGLKSVALLLLPYVLILTAIGLLKSAGLWTHHYKLRLLEIFNFSYWREHFTAIAWYIREENFTFIYSLLASCGMVLALFKRESLLDRFLLGWMASIGVYCLFFPEDIYQNSYSQMPFLGAVCIGATYAVSFIAQELKKTAKSNVLAYVMIAAVGISAPSVKNAITRMHATVFLGQDVAGETLKELTAPDERVFLFTHAQGYAISRYAHRYVGWPSDLEDFKKKEEKFGVRFVCFYPGEYFEAVRINQPAIFGYIQNHYRIREVGLIDTPDKLGYILLEKGKGRNIKEALESLSGRLETRSIYKILGRYVFGYTIRPEGPDRK